MSNPINNTYLPASNGSGDAALAHATSARTIGSTTINVDTVANWPTYFIATQGTLLSSGFIDPTTKTDFYGHLSGSTLVIDGFCPGNSDLGTASGQVVVIKPNTEWANLISSGVQSGNLFPSLFPNIVEAAGGVWTQTSGLAGTQTVGNVWYNGVRYSIPAVASFTFTASKDTYVDVNPSTGAYTYVPVANLAAEPAVTASCVRVAKVITGASAIIKIVQSLYNTPSSQNALHNPYKFSAYRAAAFTSGSAAFVKVPVDSIVFDTSSNVDIVTNNRFIAPVSGYYQINWCCSNGGGTNFLIASIYKNGAEFTRGAKISTGSNSSGGGSTGSDTVFLTAGDYVELWVYSSSAVAVENGGPTGVRPILSGFLVSIT